MADEKDENTQSQSKSNLNDAEKLVKQKQKELELQEKINKLVKERNEATGKRKELIEKELELKQKIKNNDTEGVEALVESIADLKKEISDLEKESNKLKEAQERLNEAFEAAGNAAESYLGAIGFGSSPGLKSAMDSLKVKLKLVKENTISLSKAIGSSVGEFLNFATAGFKVDRLLLSFIGNSIDLIKRLDATRAAFVKLGPQFEELARLTKQNRQEVLAYGGDLEELSKSFQSLSTNLNYFNFLSKEEQKNLGFLTTGFNNFGADVTKVSNILMTGLNMSAQEVGSTLLKMKAASDTLGVSVGQLIGSFERSLPVLARFGDSADEVFLKLEAISKMTGLSSDQLSGFARKFDTLEGASSTVQRLNAYLGTTAFNMGEMLELDYGERIQVIRERVNNLAGSFQNLSPYMQDSFANLLGMTNSEAVQFFNNTAQATEDLTRSTLESTMSTAEFAEKSRETQTAIERLKRSVQALSVASMPLIEGLNTLVDAVTVITLRFTGASEEANKFSQSTRNIASAITAGGVVIMIYRVVRAFKALSTVAPTAGAAAGTGLRSMATGMAAFNAPAVAGGFAKFSFILAGAAGLFALLAGGAIAMALNATSRALDSFAVVLQRLEGIGAGNVVNTLRRITAEIREMGRTIEENFQDRDAAINFTIATNSLANLARETANLNAASLVSISGAPAAVSAGSAAAQGDVNISVYLDGEEITSRMYQSFQRRIEGDLSTGP